MLLSLNSQKARTGVLPALLVGALCLLSAAPAAGQQTTPTGVTLTASDLTPTEGETVTLTATLDAAAPTGGVTLTLKVIEKVSETIYTSATATADYTLSSSTISIAEGGESGTATLSIVDDNEVEDYWYSIAGETLVLSAGSTTPVLASKPLIITILDNDGDFAGRRASQPTLEAITSGINAPTATTLSFNVGCVRGGGSLITDYRLWAENVDDSSDYYSQTFDAPDPAVAETCVTIVRTMTVLPSRPSATTYRVRANARSILGFRTPWSDPVEVATPANAVQVGGGDPEPRTETFALANNHPNPFNPTTMIRYVLPQAADVELTVYNALGQPVRTLVAAHQRAGRYAVEWDATGLAAGMYFYRLQAGGEFLAVEKMLLLK